MKAPNPRSRLLIALLVSALITNGSSSASQDRAVVLERARFQHLSVSDGLPQSTVRCILQDQLGFIWFGTFFGGLARYDGHDFLVFTHDPEDEHSLCSNQVSALAEDCRGNIWVGTHDKGVCRLDPSTRRFQSYTEMPGDDRRLGHRGIRQILTTRDGELWVNTHDGFLFRFDFGAQEFRVLTLTDASIRAMAQDASGATWVISSRFELFVRDPGAEAFRRVGRVGFEETEEGLPTIQVMFVDSEGTLWIGTFGDGLFGYEVDSKVFRHFQTHPNELSHNLVRSIAEAADDRIWIGTDGGGIACLNKQNGQFEVFRHRPNDRQSLSNDQVYTVFRDRTDIMWIGNYHGGVNIFNPHRQKFSHVTHAADDDVSMAHPSVLSLTEDARGHVWIGTDGGGIQVWDPRNGKTEVKRHDPDDLGSLSGNIITAFAWESTGRLWIGTWLAGLNVTEPASGRYSHYRHASDDPDSLSSDIVWAILEDKQGSLWVGTTGGGLNRLMPKTDSFLRYMYDSEDPQSLSHNDVGCLLEDSRGNLWIGTWHGGLNIMDRETGSFRRFQHRVGDKHSLSHDDIRVVFEDHRQNIWIGTQGGGLNRFDRETETFEQIGTAQGLASQALSGILEDENGHLWVSHDRGLSRYDPVTGNTRNFDASDGLGNGEFNLNACVLTRDQLMVFGGVSGISLFRPDQVETNPHVPPVVFTELRIFNRPVAIQGADSPLRRAIELTDHLVLTHRDSVFSLTFAALSYTANHKNCYAFRLEGFDEDWSISHSQRTATYTNLDPGEYVFQVKAANHDGVWNEAGISLPITITPPFWGTWWFRTLAAVLALATALGMHRYRVLTIRRRNLELQHQVDERTHELKTTQDRLVESAYKTGMAEIASESLHHIGNQFNSVQISCDQLLNLSCDPHLARIRKANKLLEETLMERDTTPKRNLLLKYYASIEASLAEHQRVFRHQADEMIQKTCAVRESLNTLQRYADMRPEAEVISMVSLIEDAIHIQRPLMDRHAIHVEQVLAPVPPCHAPRTRLAYAIMNVLENSRESLERRKTLDHRRIRVLLNPAGNDQLQLVVEDNGCGFPKEASSRIFEYGYSTKKNGFGFGLHVTANAIKEMGGSIHLTSPGENQGCTATIILPTAPAEMLAANRTPGTS